MRFPSSAALAVASSILAGVAGAQSLQFKVADVYPVGHFVAEALTKPWMQEVTERTKGAATFQYYPGEQLGKGKDLLQLTQSGVVDVGLVIPSFVSDKLPLSAVAELPGSFATSCQGTLAYWALAKDGLLRDVEWGPSGVRVLFAIVLPPYPIFAKQSLERLKGFEGLKIYSTGGAKDLTIRRLGAVPIRMGTPEVFESLTRGTIDGVLLSYSSTLAYKLPGLVKYGTVGENFGSGVITYTISEARFRQLPAAVQSAMVEAGDAGTRRACARVDQDVTKDMAKLRDAGVTLVRLSDADHKTVRDLAAGVNREWAADLDKRGKPASKVLDAFTRALPKS